MNDTDIQLVKALKVDERAPTDDETARQRLHLLSMIEELPKDSTGRLPQRSPLFHRLRLAAVFGVAVILVGIFVNVVTGQRAVAQIEVEQVDGFYEITIVELGEDTSQIESELEALGVDITIDFIPVSPSLEGQVVSFGIDEEMEPVLDPETGKLTMFRVPVDWKGRGLIELGRPALEGETYDSSASPLASGEALDDVACDAIFNQPIESVNHILSERGFEADIRWDHDGASEKLSLDEASGMFVVQVGYTAPDIIQVWVEPAPAEITDDFLEETVGRC